MAYDNPGNDDMYSDAADSSPTAAPADKEMAGDEKTATLPKHFFGSKELKVGNRCEVEIAAIHDNEVSVKYVEHEEKETPSEKVPERDAEMASMMED